MNVRVKALTISTGFCAAVVFAGVLVLFGSSAETQVTAPAPPAERVSVAFNGAPPNGSSSGAVTSGDGRCVAFYSDATNLIPFVRPTFTNVYLVDRDVGETVQVSIGFNGEQPNGPSQAQRFRPSIDRDCSCVAFSSDATNLVPGDTNGKTDVFVRDLGSMTTELASFGLGGEPANGGSSFSSVSGDCQQVAFHSVATNLVPDDTNNTADVFVLDRGTGVITRVSVGPGGEQANGPSITPSMSADGRCVAFASSATNLLPDLIDSNNQQDIYVACDGVVTCRASVSSSGEEANAVSFLPALNEDGTIVAFKSNASNLVPNDRNQVADVFVHNCVTGETVRASVGNEGQEGNDIAIPPSISGDGRFVAFGSFASNLIRGTNNNMSSQVYVRDLVNMTTQMITTSPTGQPGNAGIPDIPPSISLDGSFVAFQSMATNLVPGNQQGFLDVFIRLNETVVPSPTPTATGDGQPTPTSTPGTPGTPTATPTPMIPCNQDTDCPLGQVCGPDDVCVPAPTPTPTIACTDPSQCPSGFDCIDGVCRDPSTPTATPTPLRTCTMDDECEEGEHCRAGVCVPIRPCPDGQVNCRGEREACLDGTCECGGDCNLDGIVFGTEITRMVCIVGAECGIDVCPAGDINQDGEVTAGDVTLAVINLGLGCPGEGSPLIFALDRTNETRTLNIGSTSGIPGEFVTVEIGMSGGDEVTTAQVDILIDNGLLDVSLTEPVCTIHPRLLQEGSFSLESTLPQVPPVAPGQLRMRVAILDQEPPIESFGDGPLMTCQFRIQPGAAPGFAQLLADGRLEIGDPAFNQFNAEVTNGAIEILPRTMCTDNSMCPPGTECLGGECRPIIECSGPMAGPSQCLDGRQACVNNRCQCVGDCNNDGIVRSNEISTMIAIINDQVPLEVCPAADFTGDGIIRSNEISIAIVNINQGCP